MKEYNLCMIIEGRKRISLGIVLLWAAIAAMSYFISDTHDSGYWIIILLSLLVLAWGLAVFLFGKIGLLFPYCFLSDEDMREYNVEKISFTLGILMMTFACMFPFLLVSFLVLIAMVCVGIPLEIWGLYTIASNKYRADAQNTEKQVR